MDTLDQHLRLLFLPWVSKAGEQLVANGNRLAHYTRAEVGLQIIGGRRIWMRNASVMNDFSEIEHGQLCLRAAWASDPGIAFRNWLGGLFPQALERVVRGYDEMLYQLKHRKFMVSVSEHPPGEEDQLGRLSMCRAYGGSSGVALIMRTAPFLIESDVLKAHSAPVLYKGNRGSETISASGRARLCEAKAS